MSQHRAYSGVPDPNDRCRPRFYIRTMEDVEASKLSDIPVFVDVEYVQIFSPGNKLEIPDFRVCDRHKKRWPDAYKAFKEGDESNPIDGYPITEWPQITRSMAETLKAVNIRAVEDLAAAGDEEMRRMGPGYYNIKFQAIEFLKTHNSAQSKIDKLEAQNLELVARLDKLEAEKSEQVVVVKKTPAKVKAKAK